jgi:hypothetical protein
LKLLGCAHRQTADKWPLNIFILSNKISSNFMKKLSIGIQSIKKILKNKSYAYVDKTKFVKGLIEADVPHYFMSRPKCFGKSSFLDTLKEVFQGNKELFKGCHIEGSQYGWEEHPVISFDFSKIANRDPIEFEMSLRRTIEEMARSYGLSIQAPTVQEGLIALISGLFTKSDEHGVVVLVDEYDKPLIDRLGNSDVIRGNQDLLKGFFGTLKSLDEYIRFTFVTGVSKFSQVSLFSGPNHLTDITMDPKYTTMMGYTEEELKSCFLEHIQAIAKKKSQAEDAIVDEIRKWYNGYRFSKKEASVYNPYSTLRFLSSGDAEGYWYSTGTPSFLIDQVKKHPQSVLPSEGYKASRTQLADISKVDQIDLLALMFQTGYLTIRGYNEEENFYDLDFPNQEVREAFFDSLLKEFVGIDPLEVSRMAQQVKKDLETYNLDAFFSKMNTHFAKISYQQFSGSTEGFYQAVFFTFLERSGISTLSEITTNIGRIDLVTELPKVVCIFELKLDQTAEVALDQAQTKKYKQRYSHSGKELLIIGLNFSSQSRNIESWKAALYTPSGSLIREIRPVS